MTPTPLSQAQLKQIETTMQIIALYIAALNCIANDLIRLGYSPSDAHTVKTALAAISSDLQSRMDNISLELKDK
jgi:hypothetical protein